MADISPANLDKIESKLDKLLEKVAKLEALAATESDRCPFREEVARAANNVARLERVEGRVEATAEKLERRVNDVFRSLAKRVDANTDNIHLLRLSWAKLVGLMIGAGAAGGVIADGFAKLFS